jgi:hypothetical protein
MRLSVQSLGWTPVYSWSRRFHQWDCPVPFTKYDGYRGAPCHSISFRPPLFRVTGTARRHGMSAILWASGSSLTDGIRFWATYGGALRSHQCDAGAQQGRTWACVDLFSRESAAASPITWTWIGRWPSELLKGARSFVPRNGWGALAGDMVTGRAGSCKQRAGSQACRPLPGVRLAHTRWCLERDLA